MYFFSVNTLLTLFIPKKYIYIYKIVHKYANWDAPHVLSDDDPNDIIWA